MIKIKQYLLVFVALGLMFTVIFSTPVNAETVAENVDLAPANLPISINTGDKLIVDITGYSAASTVAYAEMFLNNDTSARWGIATSSSWSILYNETSYTIFVGSTETFADDYTDSWISWSSSGNIGTLEFLQDWTVAIDTMYKVENSAYTEITDYSYTQNLGMYGHFELLDYNDGEASNNDEEETEQTYANGDYVVLENDVDVYLIDVDVSETVTFFYDGGYMYLDDLETPIKDLNASANKLVFIGDDYFYVEIVDPLNNVTYSYNTSDWDIREIEFSVDGSNVLTVTYEETTDLIDETEYQVSADTYLRLSNIDPNATDETDDETTNDSGDVVGGGIAGPEEEANTLNIILICVGIMGVIFFVFTKKGRKIIGLR